MKDTQSLFSTELCKKRMNVHRNCLILLADLVNLNPSQVPGLLLMPVHMSPEDPGSAPYKLPEGEASVNHQRGEMVLTGIF